MSIFGQPPGQGSNSASANSPTATSTRGNFDRSDLQAAFNWLVNQPEHIRKQASDPDRLMTLYYRSTNGPAGSLGPTANSASRGEVLRTETRNESRNESRTESTRTESARFETEAPVSSQTFISDLRQINEAMRQFDGPGAQAAYHPHMPTGAAQVVPHAPAPAAVHAAVSHPAPSYNPGPGYSGPAGYTAGTHYPMTTYPAIPAKTQIVLAEVREKLNLSSDAEALNLLVSLGYRSLKPLLG